MSTNKSIVAKPLNVVLRKLSIFTVKDASSASLYPLLIIGRKSCNMISILNKLTLQKELQNCVKYNVLVDKKLKHYKNKTTNQTLKPLAEPGIEPGTSCTQSECVTTALPSQLTVSIVVKLFLVLTQ